MADPLWGIDVGAWEKTPYNRPGCTESLSFRVWDKYAATDDPRQAGTHLRKLLTTIRSRDAELDTVEEKLRLAEAKIARLTRERDEAQTARAHTASDNLELARRLEQAEDENRVFRRTHERLRSENQRLKSDNSRRFFQGRASAAPQWVAVERSTTVTGEWGRERITTVTTREVAK